MSDAEGGQSDFDYEEVGGYNDSEGDLDEIAEVLGDDQGRVSEDADEEVPTESDEDDEDTPLPEQNAPGTLSKQPRIDKTELAGISSLILPLLQAGYLAWKAERGNKRKKVWKDILRDLRILPEHSLLTQSQWDLKGQLYLRWMRRQGQNKPKKSDFFPTPKWTLRKVVKREKVNRINEILQTEYGVKLGTAQMLTRYQEALTQVIEELSPSETEDMQQMAEKWNEHTEPDSVKARFATREMTPLVRKFTEAMWKRGGVRMLVLAGYKDEQNALMTACFDYNSQFDDGPRFRDASTIEGPWDRYIKRCFHDDSDDLSENDNGSKDAEGARPKKENNHLSGEAALKLVVLDDGGIWIPELLGRNRSDLQALVRAYLTAQYRKVCKKPRASAPFKKLARYQDRLFAERHLPGNFTFPSDPSHMLTSDALRFLQFIRERQQKFPEDVFAFQYTLDRDGDLVDVAQDTDDSDTEALVGRDRQRSKPQNKNKSAGTAPSRQVAVSKTYVRKSRAGSDEDAEETDAEQVVASRKPQAAPRPPRSRTTPRLPNEDIPNIDHELPRGLQKSRPAARMPNNPDDELPRNMEADAPGQSAEMPGKSANAKGKQVRRPKAIVEVGRATALSTQKPPSAGSSATSLKIGPPRGVKRSKDIGKEKALPKQHSAPKGAIGTASSKDDYTGKLPDREPSGPLKSALKASNARQTDESEENIPTPGNGAPKNHKMSRPSHRGDGSRSIPNPTSRAITPQRSVPTEAVDNALESMTPRRSNRERRAPARVDEEEPSLKRPAPTGPLTAQFKAKRTRFNQ